jgi:hypothetical protein
MKTHFLIRQIVRASLIGMVMNTGAEAANFYVDSAVTASGSGQSWAAAFKSFSAITWSSISPGDTIYISGGASSKTYTSGLTVGKSGTSTARITIRVGQDAGHTGTVIFDKVGITALQNYVTINGAVGNEKRLLIQNLFDVLTAENGVAVDAGGTTGLIVENIAVNNCNNGVLLTRGNGYTVRNSNFTAMRGDYVIRGIMSAGSWDANKIHDNYIQTLYNDSKPAGSGTYGYAGPDSIQPGDGTSIFGNRFVVNKSSEYTSAQHPDTIQLAGSEIKVYNNVFENIGDSNIDYDAWYGGTLRNIYIYNNLFHLVEDVDPYPEYMRFYSTRDPLNSFSGLKIVNNTFIDDRVTSRLAPRIGFGFGNGSGYGTGNEFRNNLFRGAHGLSMSKDTGGAQFSMAYSNNVYSNYLSMDPSGVVAVPALDLSFVPTASDTVARDRGMPMSFFSTDKRGISRPQGSGWDIGSFEYSSGGAAPSAPLNLRVQ